MNWREWAQERLTTIPELIADVPVERVMSASSLTGSPPLRRFVLYRMSNEDIRMNDADVPLLVDHQMEIWVYDNPGSYNAIERYLEVIRKKLPGQVTTVGQAHACVWQGTSGELADDELKCITKFASFKLVGGVQ